MPKPEEFWRPCWNGDTGEKFNARESAEAKAVCWKSGRHKPRKQLCARVAKKVDIKEKDMGNTTHRGKNVQHYLCAGLEVRHLSTRVLNIIISFLSSLLSL